MKHHPLPERRSMSALSRLTWPLIAVLGLVSPLVQSEKLVVANKAAASVTVFDLETRAAVATLPTGPGPHEVAVSPDGRRAAVTDYGVEGAPGQTITLIGLDALVVEGTVDLPPGARPHGIEWLDEGWIAVTAEGIESVLMVDLAANRVERTAKVGQLAVHMIAVDPADGLAYTANIGSGTASVVDIAQGQTLGHLPSGKGAEGIALVDGGKELWVSNRAEDSVTIFDTRTRKMIDRIVTPGFPIRVEADDTRRRVYVTLPARDRMAVIDTRTREVLREIEFDVPQDPTRKSLLADWIPNSSIPIGVLLSGDGRTLFVAHSASHRVSIWDAETLEPRGSIVTGIEPDGMAWSPR